MNWILTIPSDFSLETVLRRSRPLLLPPFRANYAHAQLERIERLGSGKTIFLLLRQTPGGLHLQANRRLNGTETEEISRKTWRILRLGENFTPFLEQAGHDRIFSRYTRAGARILRGATLFEDVVKAIILTHPHGEANGEPAPADAIATGLQQQLRGVESRSAQRIAWIIDRLGTSLPSNPTLHAFPTPSQLLWEEHLVKEILGPELGAIIANLAARFEDDSASLHALEQSDTPLETVRKALAALPGSNPSATALMMLALGRYEYLPVDQYARQRISQQWYHGEPIGPQEIKSTFASWQPWGGLLYWLWVWSTDTAEATRKGAY